MYRKVAIGVGMCLFVVLNITDWMLTFALLRIEPTATESNPVAAVCLKRYGWDGLAIYKACAMVVFLSAVILIARRRPKVAGRVLVFACSALLAVTVYTHELICETHRLRKEYGLGEEIPSPASRYSKSSLPTPKNCPFPTAEDSSPHASR